MVRCFFFLVILATLKILYLCHIRPDVLLSNLDEFIVGKVQKPSTIVLEVQSMKVVWLSDVMFGLTALQLGMESQVACQFKHPLMNITLISS